MKNLLEFNKFFEEDKPMIYIIDSYRAKHGSYSSEVLKQKERDVLKKMAGKEIEAPTVTEDGKRYIIKTGDPDVPTLELPKNYVISEVKK
jgi:hypothetical protein